MKPPVLALLVALACYLAGSACATFPKRVPSPLRHPQPIGQNITPGTANTDMITWKQPIPKPPHPQNPTSAYSTQRCPLGFGIHEYWNVDGEDMEMIHGRTVASQFSGADFWGTHRYRDWNIVLVPETDNQVFLSTANSLFQGGWEDDAVVSQTVAEQNPDLDKIIELEWDSGFFAPELAPAAGDETLTIGRWIFDCGHESLSSTAPPVSLGYRAEIHAPEILLSSHIVQMDASRIQAKFRFFAGSRSGPTDVFTPIFFIQRFFETYKNPLAGQDYSANLHAPGDGWKIASCTSTPGARAGGWAKRIHTEVKSDDGGKSLTLTLPTSGVKGNRIESSKIVDVTWVRQDSSSSGGMTQCESPSGKH